MHVVFCVIALGAAPPSGFLRELPGSGWLTMEVGSFVVSSDGARVTASGEVVERMPFRRHYEVRRWAIGAGKQEKLWNLGQREARCLMLSADGKSLFAFTRDDDLLTWTHDEAAPRTLGRRSGLGDWYKAATLPDGETAAVWTWERAALVGLAKGGEKGRLRLPSYGDVRPSPDGKFVAATNEEDLEIWDLIEGKRTRTFPDHKGRPNALSFQPDGSRLCYLCTRSLGGQGRRSMAHVRDLKTGKVLLEAEVEPGLLHGWTALSPSGRLLAVLGDTDTQGRGHLRLYDVANGGELARLDFTRRDGWPVGLMFSRDGRTLVVGLTRHIKAFRVGGRP